MRAAPPSRALSFPVTGALAAAATIVTLAFWSGRSIAQLDMGPAAFWAEPWRLLTSALPHADILHLAFNVYWLWVFGTFLEERLGHVMMLGSVVLLGVGSAAAEYAIFDGGIGLSGIGYGLFGMLYVLDRRDSRFAGGMDTRTAQLFVGWFFLCIALTVTHVWAIANVAHGAGAVLGGLLGLALARPRAGREALTWAKPVLAAAFAMCLLGATSLRPRINQSKAGGAGSAHVGYEALVAGKYDEAVTRFDLATRESPGVADYWYDYGIALWHVGRVKEATSAFDRASALEPGNQEFQNVAREFREGRIPASVPSG